MAAAKKKAATRKRAVKKKAPSKKTTRRRKGADVSKGDKEQAPKEPKTSFTPEEAKRLLQADLAKIVAKSKDPNKRLTAAERNLLIQYAQAESPDSIELAAPSFAKSIAELCGILGVTRETYYDWKRKYPNDLPPNTTNGQYDVAAWRLFASERGLKGGEPNRDDPETLEDFRKEDLKIKIEERELKVAILRQDFIDREDVREAITGLVAGTIKLLRDRFENELPPVCAGLDAARIQKENAAAIDEVCRLLQEGGAAMSESRLEELDES